jgi:hypothetical protein
MRRWLRRRRERVDRIEAEVEALYPQCRTAGVSMLRSIVERRKKCAAYQPLRLKNWSLSEPP